MFLVLLQYTQPLGNVDEFMSEHSAFLESNYQARHFIFSGRRIPRVGGVILANLDDGEQLMSIIREDPFYKNGIADYNIIQFTPTKFDARFSCLVNDDAREGVQA